MKAYAHFGTGTAGPFLTVEVPLKDDGKGRADRTNYKVLVFGRWRRVLVGYGLFVAFPGESHDRLSIQLAV